MAFVTVTANPLLQPYGQNLRLCPSAELRRYEHFLKRERRNNISTYQRAVDTRLNLTLQIDGSQLASFSHDQALADELCSVRVVLGRDTHAGVLSGSSLMVQDDAAPSFELTVRGLFLQTKTPDGIRTGRLSYLQPTAHAERPVRSERHVESSISTMRARIIAVLVHQFPCCPVCQRRSDLHADDPHKQGS